MSLYRKWMLGTTWVIIVASCGFAAYVQFVALPRLRAEVASYVARPPDVPCTQGMTLLPGQTCYAMIVVPMRPPMPAKEDGL
jgi:hypothetical protein